MNDSYVLEAKHRGLRSRSAFKLLDIQKKYALIHPGHSIVDLGCAPGGWVQISLQNTGKTGCVVGIDKLEVPPISGATILQGDFSDDHTPNRIKDLLPGNRAHGVLSDMSANTTGHKPTDHLQIMALVEMATHFALNTLVKDGYFVAKVFSGGAENSLLSLLKKNFAKVSHYKPPSSRKNSAEMYVIAVNFKGNYCENSVK